MGILSDLNIGWVEQIKGLLEAWSLDTDWATLASRGHKIWKNEVKSAAEKINRNKLRIECIAKSRGEEKIKTKTKSIIPKLDYESYKREPLPARGEYSFEKTKT